MNKRKTFLFALAALAALAVAALCLACDKKPSGITPTPGDDDGDPEQFVMSITYSGEYRQEYYEGEAFDPTGLIVTATWYDGDVETLGARDYTIEPAGALAVGTTNVRIVYEDNFADIPVTVNEITPTGIELENKPDITQYYGSRIPFSRMSVYAVVDGGERVKLAPSLYTVELDDAEVTGDVEAPECDIHTVRVSFKDKMQEFDLVVIDGTRIEAENIVVTESVTEQNKNFVEKIDNQNFKPFDHDTASGGSYIGDTANAVIIFHVWAEKAGKATLILRAASGSGVPSSSPDAPDPWGTPMQMNAMVFADSASVRIKASGAEFETLSVDSNVILPGGVALTDDGKFNEMGDPDLWVNWFDVPFGEYDFAVGDNVVEITVNSAMNIDRFEIRYLPETHQHDGRGMVHTAKVEASCQAPGVKEYYTCGLCGKRYSDINGTNELSRLLSEQLEHDCDYSLSDAERAEKEYFAGQRFDSSGLPNGAKCKTCEAFVQISVDTGSDDRFIETDTEKVVVSCGNKHIDIPIKVKGIVVNADRYKKADGTGNYSGNGSYTENRDNCGYTVNDCDYTQVATGHKYFGGVRSGDIFYFHIVSDKATKADLALSIASSNVASWAGDGAAWTVPPTQTWNIQFNSDTFKVWKNDKNSESISAVDTWAGGNEATDKENGDWSLLEKWCDVNIGSIDINAGDNLIIIQVPGAININELVCTFTEI